MPLLVMLPRYQGYREAAVIPGRQGVRGAVARVDSLMAEGRSRMRAYACAEPAPCTNIVDSPRSPKATAQTERTFHHPVAGCPHDAGHVHEIEIVSEPYSEA